MGEDGTICPGMGMRIGAVGKRACGNGIAAPPIFIMLGSGVFNAEVGKEVGNFAAKCGSPCGDAGTEKT